MADLLFFEIALFDNHNSSICVVSGIFMGSVSIRITYEVWELEQCHTHYTI